MTEKHMDTVTISIETYEEMKQELESLRKLVANKVVIVEVSTKTFDYFWLFGMLAVFAFWVYRMSIIVDL